MTPASTPKTMLSASMPRAIRRASSYRSAPIRWPMTTEAAFEMPMMKIWVNWMTTLVIELTRHKAAAPSVP